MARRNRTRQLRRHLVPRFVRRAHSSERRSPSRRGRRSSTRPRRATGSSRRSRGVSWTSRRSRPSSHSPRTPRALEEEKEEASWWRLRSKPTPAKGAGVDVLTATVRVAATWVKNYALDADQGSYASSAGVTTVPGESSANSDVVSFGAVSREEQDLTGFDSDSGEGKPETTSTNSGASHRPKFPAEAYGGRSQLLSPVKEASPSKERGTPTGTPAKPPIRLEIRTAGDTTGNTLATTQLCLLALVPRRRARTRPRRASARCSTALPSRRRARRCGVTCGAA